MDHSDDLIRQLRAPDQRSCGRMAGGMGTAATDRLTELDQAAATIRAWHPLLIPGLLQTRRYAAATIRSRTPSLPAEEARARVECRAVRSMAFLRRFEGGMGGSAPLHASFIFGEAALTQSVTDADAHAEQLAHLLKIMSNYPRIRIEVLPDDASTAGTIEPFSVHSLEDGPRVGHLETIIGGWYTTRTEDVARLYSAFSVVGSNSLNPGRTREAITGCVWEGRSIATTVRSSGSRPTATPTVACTSPAPEELPPSQ